MNALFLLGVIFGASYTTAIWLAIEHINGHGSAWNLLVVPIALGGILLVLLFIWTLLDAYEGGMRDE